MKPYCRMFLALFAVALFTSSGAVAQLRHGNKTDEQLAKEGIKKTDEGKYDEAIEIFNTLIARDSLKTEYQYEKGLALYLKQDYPKAIEIFEKLSIQTESNPNYYQILGNSYDFLDQKEKAIDAYEAGLKRFPNAGRLFMELGNIKLTQRDYDQALQYWENGISADPMYPGNYYFAAKATSQTREKIWTILYGEIFLNLEPASKRSTEISELLFKTYASVIDAADSTGVLKFSFQRTILQGENVDPNLPPLEVTFENVMAKASQPLLKKSRKPSIGLISDLRSDFIRQWTLGSYEMSYRNILFDRQAAMQRAGVLKAYNYWLLQNGDPDEFTKWYSANKADFKKFYEWAEKNTLSLSQEYKFSRYQ